MKLTITFHSGPQFDHIHFFENVSLERQPAQVQTIHIGKETRVL